MDDQKHFEQEAGDLILTAELKKALKENAALLKGYDKRRFMAQIVHAMGRGGIRRAQRELGWNPNTVIKGLRELESGIRCIDNFSAKGRKPAEAHLPKLLDDIKNIVEPISQIDPTFRTDNKYCPLSAGEVRRRLIEDKNYSDEQLPKERTIRKKLNDLGFKPQKVAKSKPLKKTS